MNCELLGVYKVKNDNDALLLEFSVDCSPSDVNLMNFTQKVPCEKKSNWQVPYNEKYLNDTGDKVIGGMFEGPKLSGKTTRVCFYMFDLDLNKPLLTPFGDIKLSNPISMPKRLLDLTEDDF